MLLSCKIHDLIENYSSTIISDASFLNHETKLSYTISCCSPFNVFCHLYDLFIALTCLWNSFWEKNTPTHTSSSMSSSLPIWRQNVFFRESPALLKVEGTVSQKLRPMLRYINGKLGHRPKIFKNHLVIIL